MTRQKSDTTASLVGSEFQDRWTRRRFLSALSAAGAMAAVPFSSRKAFAQESSIAATFTIGATPGVKIPTDFTGLSYETSQLAHTAFFSRDSATLTRYFKLLGEDGVLRIGGNMSEFSFWDSKAKQAESSNGVEGPDPGHGSDRTYRITPEGIDHLADFLKRTNWKLIYGLNLAAGTPKSAAEEAAYVSKAVGDKLIALQFGNEPDLFKHNKNPNDHWSYDEFMEHWKLFYKAVHERVPNVKIAGPDTSYQPVWLKRFAEEEKSRIGLISSHYYAGGPPTDPKMTTKFLLEANSRLENHVLAAIRIAKANGLPYRMSEGNTCYGAGKKDVSDTFASALWVLDFWLYLAAQGSTGVNLHGGGNGYYTPIAGSPSNGFVARPIFYGMMMAGEFAGATLLPLAVEAQGKNVVGYAAVKGKTTQVVAINREGSAATVRVEGLKGAKKAKLWRLEAPELESKSGVTLAGAEVSSSGAWQPGKPEYIVLKDGVAELKLKPYSAALIFEG